jgi:hypothetical protein
MPSEHWPPTCSPPRSTRRVAPRRSGLRSKTHPARCRSTQTSSTHSSAGGSCATRSPSWPTTHFCSRGLAGAGATASFRDADGQLSTTAVMRIVRPIMLAADVPVEQAHPHALRHTFERLYTAAPNAELSRLRRIMGHASPETTSRWPPGLWPAHNPRRASGLTVDRRSASSGTSTAQSLAQCWCGRRGAASRKRRFRPKQRRPSGATAGVLLCRSRDSPSVTIVCRRPLGSERRWLSLSRPSGSRAGRAAGFSDGQAPGVRHHCRILSVMLMRRCAVGARGGLSPTLSRTQQKCADFSAHQATKTFCI